MKRLFLLLLLYIGFLSSFAQKNLATVELIVACQDTDDNIDDSITVYFNTDLLIKQIKKNRILYEHDSITIKYLESFNTGDTIHFNKDCFGGYIDYEVYSEQNNEFETESSFNMDDIFKLIYKGKTRIFWKTTGNEIIKVKTRKELIRYEGKKHGRYRSYIDKENGNTFLVECTAYYAKF